MHPRRLLLLFSFLFCALLPSLSEAAATPAFQDTLIDGPSYSVTGQQDSRYHLTTSAEREARDLALFPKDLQGTEINAASTGLAIGGTILLVAGAITLGIGLLVFVVGIIGAALTGETEPIIAGAVAMGIGTAMLISGGVMLGIARATARVRPGLQVGFAF